MDVTSASPPSRARRPRRATQAAVHAGERLGGFIYGTIVALAVTIDGSNSSPDEVGRVALLVGVTSFTFWLAHVYARGLGESVARDERLSFRELRAIGRRELPLVEGAALPVVALALGALGVLTPDHSYWLAVALGIGVLVLQGLRYARIEHLGVVGSVAVVGANVTFGLILVALKLFAMH